jgi:hypothetical protein
MNQKIKPCPFCGGDSHILTICTPDREGSPCSISCDDCGATGPTGYVAQAELNSREAGTYPVSTVTGWNMRPRSQEPRQEVPKVSPHMLLNPVDVIANTALNSLLIAHGENETVYDFEPADIDVIVRTSFRVADAFFLERAIRRAHEQEHGLDEGHLD